MPRNNYFQFKQFRVVQEYSAMKVGMDGVLLGAWANAAGAERILDIGTGTGLIALMMAQRNCTAKIEAIEIDEDAFQEALTNISHSPWSNRITPMRCTFQEFAAKSVSKYDLVVSNPPFFSSGAKAPAENRALARHSDSLPLKVLISGAAGMLNKNGKMALVLPFEYLSEAKRLAKVYTLYFSRICKVKPNPQKPAFRVLIELTRSAYVGTEENLTIEFERHHDYTPEYKSLTKDFYLKF